jgi:DNA-binding CsgD family transcriptional regulator
MGQARPPGPRRRPALLALLVALQGIAALAFVGDVAGDLSDGAPVSHMGVEAMVSLALLAGLGFCAAELRRQLALMRRQEQALEVAAGALVEVVNRSFADWHLTPAEQDVALLALKGLDVAEIATLRGAAQGTVRAQLTSIYAKSGVSGRAQFAALFVEDLLGQGVPPR